MEVAWEIDTSRIFRAYVWVNGYLTFIGPPTREWITGWSKDEWRDGPDTLDWTPAMWEKWLDG